MRHGHGITWRFEGRELDEETRRLTVHGVETPIERKPFEVLLYLLRNPDRAVRKQELLEALWPGRILSETVLSRAVMLARQAIGDDDQQFIKTVYGYGYRLIATLEKLQRGLPLPLPSIAVLPFVNLSGESENDYLSDGMTEEIMAALVKVRGLRVASRASAFAYKGTAYDLPQVGRTLGVYAVLEGGLQRDRYRIRLAVKLFRASDGSTLWAETYQRVLGDVFALQDELSRSIADALQVVLSAPGDSQTADRQPISPRAFDSFLKGKHHCLVQDETVNRQAIAELEEAIHLDPGFARGYAELSRACHTRIYWIAPEDKESLKLGFAAAERALALDPHLAAAHYSRALLAFTPASQFAYTVVIKELKKTLALDRNLAGAWFWLSSAYMHVGLLDEAMRAAETAMGLDPSDFAVNFQYLSLPIWMGEFERGLDGVEQLPRNVNPTVWYWHTIWALRSLGRIHEAHARANEFLQHHQDRGGLISAARATLHAASGDADKAQEAIRIADSADRRFGHFHHTAYEIAGAYALMKRTADAIQYLQEAINTGFPCRAVIENDPNLETLRGDTRFQEALQAAHRQRTNVQESRWR